MYPETDRHDVVLSSLPVQAVPLLQEHCLEKCSPGSFECPGFDPDVLVTSLLCTVETVLFLRLCHFRELCEGELFLEFSNFEDSTLQTAVCTRSAKCSCGSVVCGASRPKSADFWQDPQASPHLTLRKPLLPEPLYLDLSALLGSVELGPC